MRAIVAIAVTVLTCLPPVAAAQTTCDMVDARFQLNALTPLTAHSACDAETELASQINVEGTRICYETGLEDVQTAGQEAPDQIRIRRGTEVEIIAVEDMQASLTTRIARDESVDTVTLQLAAIMCQSQYGARLALGDWRISGSDAGSTFSADGFFPSQVMRVSGIDYLPMRRQRIRLSFDLPQTRLANDPEPRTIAGTVGIPLEMYPKR